MEDITDADYLHDKKNFYRFWNKKFRRISYFVCSKQYIIVSWYIWELSKYVPWNKWTWSCKTSFSFGLTWQAALKKTKGKLDLLTDIDVIAGTKRY